MNHSPTLTALASALSAAQAEIEHASKNASNPAFKNKYANLAEIIDTSKPVLTKHGLAVVQMPGFAEGVVTVETMLLHKSGEWLSGVTGAPIVKNDPQGVGSAVTYCRRYALAALCFMTQDDDDGNAASTPRHEPAQRAEPQRRGPAAAPDAAPALKSQVAAIMDMLNERDVDADTRSKTLTALEENPSYAKAENILKHLTKFPKAKASAA